MCDYSLEFYRSRPARAGEEYTSHRFPSGSIGFVSPGDVETAVCMACDMKLRIENVPTYLQDAHGIGKDETVTFARLETGPHHDGVRFDNGAEVTLQQLGPGVKACVIDELRDPIRATEEIEELV